MSLLFHLICSIYGEFGILVVCNMTFKNDNLTRCFDNCEWQFRMQESADRRQKNMGGWKPSFSNKTNTWTLM